MVYLHPRAEWVSTLLDEHNILYSSDQMQVLSTPCKRIVIDMLQSNSCASKKEIVDYSSKFDTVLLIDHESTPTVPLDARAFNFDNVVLLSTSRIFTTADKIKNLNFPSSFFSVVAKLNWNIEKLPLIDNPKNKDKMFDALLGAPKPHRSRVYDFLNKNPNISAVIKMQYTDNIEHSTFFVDPGIEISNDLANLYSGNQASYKDTTMNASSFLPVEIYQQTAYSIVTETYTVPNLIFFTEKTAKPIMAKRLFVIFAGPGYLQELNNIGFKTFDNVLDESYDLEPNDVKRWDMALEQVRRLSQMNQQQVCEKIQDRLDHNQRLLLETDWIGKFNQQIIDVINENL